jgi:hypothetical protein
MGWIPVNFSSVSAGSPISNLPIDPINTTSSGKYYAYTVGSSTPSVWLVSSYPESQQYKTTTAPQGFQGAFMAGNDYTISPLYNMQGILGWWKFDETSGTVAYDSSGSGNNGTLMNGAGWGSGYVNTNLGGATTNQYISASDVPISSGDITIVALAKVNSLSLSHYGCFAMKSTNQYRPYTEWGLCYTSATLEARRNISYAVSSVAVLTGDFHQYAAVFTSSSTLFYRDGLLLQTTTALSSGTYGGSVKFAGWGSPDNYVDGSLGDLRIYNRALSGAEIQAIYNSAK